MMATEKTRTAQPAVRATCCPLRRVESFHGIQVADPRDIAGMKSSAVASRGSRRDFVDLYAVSQKYGLEKLLQTFRKKFAKVNYSMVHVLKSLTYFEDAEQEPMPDVLVPLAWNDAKQFFCREATPTVAALKRSGTGKRAVLALRHCSKRR
ncbi:MAG: nucleotidyl transferase AbiEii/AbiGii toxin family protein [Terriglobia bacterium]